MHPHAFWWSVRGGRAGFVVHYSGHIFVCRKLLGGRITEASIQLLHSAQPQYRLVAYPSTDIHQLPGPLLDPAPIRTGKELPDRRSPECLYCLELARTRAIWLELLSHYQSVCLSLLPIMRVPRHASCADWTVRKSERAVRILHTAILRAQGGSAQEPAPRRGSSG